MEGRDGKESQNRGGSSQKPTTIVRCYIGVVELLICICMDLDWMRGSDRIWDERESENKKMSRAAPGEDLRPDAQFGTDCRLGRPLSFVS